MSVDIQIRREQGLVDPLDEGAAQPISLFVEERGDLSLAFRADRGPFCGGHAAQTHPALAGDLGEKGRVGMQPFLSTCYAGKVISSGVELDPVAPQEFGYEIVLEAEVVVNRGGLDSDFLG